MKYERSYCHRSFCESNFFLFGCGENEDAIDSILILVNFNIYASNLCKDLYNICLVRCKGGCYNDNNMRDCLAEIR